MPDDNSGEERDRLAELYAALADEELQLLAHDFGSLSREGQQVLEAEFRRRGRTPGVDLHLPTQGQDVMEWDDLVMIRQFRDLPEALLVKGSL